MHPQFSEVLKFAETTGTPLVILPVGAPALAVVSFAEYQKLVQSGAGVATKPSSVLVQPTSVPASSVSSISPPPTPSSSSTPIASSIPEDFPSEDQVISPSIARPVSSGWYTAGSILNSRFAPFEKAAEEHLAPFAPGGSYEAPSADMLNRSGYVEDISSLGEKADLVTDKEDEEVEEEDLFYVEPV